MRKRLFIDIETSPNIGFFWRTGYKIDIGYDFIIKERAIICISYKWECGKVQSLTWDKHQSDEKMLKEFSKVLGQADEVIGHNEDKFDIRFLKSRFIKFGIPIMPDIITLDTLKIARTFGFNSNKLDYLAKYLGVGGKIDTGGFNLWKEIILNKDNKSLKQMVKYCENDVLILEKVWEKFNPYVKAKTRLDDDMDNCPECGSDMQRRGYSILASGKRKIRFQCKKCGKWFSKNLVNK